MARLGRRTFLVLIALVASGFVWVLVLEWMSIPLIEVHHAPARYEKRAGILSVNLTGSASTWATLRHRVNGGPWQPLTGGRPRAPSPRWTLEIMPDELRAGANWSRSRRRPGHAGAFA